ncbi:hypothetical protein LINPERPRIM_LOCUS27677 [Linum perenne]
MAAAEARAVWQRAANRCFVQEDAKRAPKLACCQSSSSSSSSKEGPTGGSSEAPPDQSGPGFIPINRTPSYPNLPPDTRWWLQLQPCYGYQKGLTFDQLNDLEAEMEILRSEVGNSDSKNSLDNNSDSTWIDVNKSSQSSSLDAAYSKVSPISNKSMEVEDDSLGLHEVLPKSNVSSFDDPESPWTGTGKNVPWWRTADKDDLASLVAQKSLDYMENCDLPPPRKMHSSDHGSSSLDWKKPNRCVSDPPIGQGSLTGGHSSGSSDKSFSPTTTIKDVGQDPESDPCKAQLLEALCHSQTRAREAEKAAKQACAEKEHIIMLFFKQASQLFAYKQWFQLLQLETIYNGLKNREDLTSSLFPVALPWMPPKGKKLRKNNGKKRGKRQRSRQDSVGKYAVAFALGLGLVGTGLLLGWTVGWMLPF